MKKGVLLGLLFVLVLFLSSCGSSMMKSPIDSLHSCDPYHSYYNSGNFSIPLHFRYGFRVNETTHFFSPLSPSEQLESILNLSDESTHYSILWQGNDHTILCKQDSEEHAPPLLACLSGSLNPDESNDPKKAYCYRLHPATINLWFGQTSTQYPVSVAFPYHLLMGDELINSNRTYYGVEAPYQTTGSREDFLEFYQKIPSYCGSIYDKALEKTEDGFILGQSYLVKPVPKEFTRRLRFVFTEQDGQRYFEILYVE